MEQFVEMLWWIYALITPPKKRQKTDKFASYFTEEYPPCGKWMSVNSGDRLSTVRPTLGPRTAKGKTRHYLKITSQQFQQRCDAG